MKFRKIIAREWLYFLSFIFVGILVKYVIVYSNSNNYTYNRKMVYDQLIKLSKENIVTFEEFSRQLDNPESRKELYDKLSKKYSFPKYKYFERKLTNSKIKNSIYNFIEGIFNFKTIVLVLILYLIFQLIRTILWSIKTLKNDT